MRIEQIMTRDVAVCAASDSLNRAAQLMWEYDCGCVPVTDGENKIVGIVTDRDITMAAYTQGKPLTDISVGEIMSRDVVTCSAGEALASAESRMREIQVRRLPVVDASGRLLGVVSLNDLAIEAAREKGSRHPEVTPAEVAKTLADICRHRPGQGITVVA
jgi:CBS domain-containing protein